MRYFFYPCLQVIALLCAGTLVLVAATMLLPLGTGGLWAKPAQGTAEGNASGVTSDGPTEPLLCSHDADKVCKNRLIDGWKGRI